MSRPPFVPTAICPNRHLGQPPNVPTAIWAIFWGSTLGRQMSRPPNVPAAKCLGRQMSQPPNVPTAIWPWPPFGHPPFASRQKSTRRVVSRRKTCIVLLHYIAIHFVYRLWGEYTYTYSYSKSPRNTAGLLYKCSHPIILEVAGVTVSCPACPAHGPKLRTAFPASLMLQTTKGLQFVTSDPAPTGFQLCCTILKTLTQLRKSREERICNAVLQREK